MNITAAGSVNVGKSSPFTTFDAGTTLLQVGGTQSGGTMTPVVAIGQTTAQTTMTNAYYLGIGANENATNSYRLIGFGYTNGGGTGYPAYVGYQETGTGGGAGDTMGDLIFGTRPTGDDVVGTERLRITSSGNLGVGTSAPKALLDLTATGTNSALIVPRDTQANRPAGNVANGMLRYNTSTSKFEGYENGTWTNMIGAASFPLVASPGTTPATAPSYAFTGSTNTGLLSQATNTVALATAGTARLTVTATGRVGIGTAAPGSALSVITANGSAYVEATANSSSAAGFMAASQSGNNTYNGFYAGGATSGSRQKFLGNFGGLFAIGRTDDSWSYNQNMLVIDNNAKVGLGIDTPAATLHVYNTTSSASASLILERSANTINNGISFFPNGADSATNVTWTMGMEANANHFYLETWDGTTTSYPLTVLNTGRIGLGVTNPTYLLQLSTDSAAKPGTGTWTVASDERLKDIRAPFTRGLEALDGIHPIYFRYKADNPLGLPSDQEYVGIRAQDALRAVPEAVSQDEQGYYHVTSDSIIWTVFNAVKDLYHCWSVDSEAKDRRIEALERENAAIKAYLCDKDPGASLCR